MFILYFIWELPYHFYSLCAREILLWAEIFNPTYVSIPVGVGVVGKRVNKIFPLSIYHRYTQVGIIEIDMLDFDVILGMY